MAEPRVEDIKAGEDDFAGNKVEVVYAKSPPDYAVYRTKFQVTIQFADDKAKARQQHSDLAALNPLRGQVNGLIDGWRSEPKSRALRSRAARYDKRVADAIVVALEGNVPHALSLLAEVRDTIVAERQAIARTDYLVWAAGTVFVLIVLLGLISAHWFGLIRTFPANATAVWTGASGGTIGAFFSIAVGLRSRSILIDLQRRDNRRDAILRIIVGTIGGGILICLFLTGLVSTFGIDDNRLTAAAPGSYADLAALVIGFFAGFSERAVPDLIAKSNVGTAAAVGAATDVAGDQARGAAAAADSPPAGAGTEQATEGDEPPPEPTAEDEPDMSVAGAPVTDAESTPDNALPPATGGVAPKQDGDESG